MAEFDIETVRALLADLTARVPVNRREASLLLAERIQSDLAAACDEIDRLRVVAYEEKRQADEDRATIAALEAERTLAVRQLELTMQERNELWGQIGALREALNDATLGWFTSKYGFAWDDDEAALLAQEPYLQGSYGRDYRTIKELRALLAGAAQGGEAHG